METYTLEQKLQRTVSKRWLKPSELLILFSNSNSLTSSSYFTNKIADKPSSGSFFILDVNKLSGKWKVDGHKYLKRKRGGGFREDVEMLRIAGVKVIEYFINDRKLNVCTLI